MTDANDAGNATGRNRDQQQREDELTDLVLASFAGASPARLRELMEGITHHLHAFIRDVRLTEQELAAGVEFLTAAGHITDDKRQEFILLSDVLGASMQTIAVNDPAQGNATESTVLGPFFRKDAPEIPLGGDISGGAAGQPCWVEGAVTDTLGNPVPQARIEVWEADEDGFYDVQYADERLAGRASIRADTDGGYRFWCLTPTPYPIPDDGPVGALLKAVGRSPMRAAHLHFLVESPGFRTLVTHVFVEGDPQLEIGDSVFGVIDSLIKRFDEQPAGTPTPDGRDLNNRSWARATFDIVLTAERPHATQREKAAPTGVGAALDQAGVTSAADATSDP